MSILHDLTADSDLSASGLLNLDSHTSTTTTLYDRIPPPGVLSSLLGGRGVLDEFLVSAEASEVSDLVQRLRSPLVGSEPQVGGTAESWHNLDQQQMSLPLSFKICPNFDPRFDQLADSIDRFEKADTITFSPGSTTASSNESLSATPQMMHYPMMHYTRDALPSSHSVMEGYNEGRTNVSFTTQDQPLLGDGCVFSYRNPIATFPLSLAGSPLLGNCTTEFRTVTPQHQPPGPSVGVGGSPTGTKAAPLQRLRSADGALVEVRSTKSISPHQKKPTKNHRRKAWSMSPQLKNRVFSAQYGNPLVLTSEVESRKPPPYDAGIEIGDNQTLSNHAKQRRDAPSSQIPNATQRDMFYKIKMCRWYQAGKCNYGDECCFAHTKSELRPAPNLMRMRMCPTHVRRGKCLDADCLYAHNKKELEKTPLYKTALCSHHIKGSCAAGDLCRYAHGPEEVRNTGARSLTFSQQKKNDD
eukprot:GHVN01055413.1.p1 GENE.GHVN01055413.1~~GHVN01055413.1.p1  ORF type:complete len:470 (-),score=40.23 GHVN01055413.1:1015-2424(-)